MNKLDQELIDKYLSKSLSAEELKLLEERKNDFVFMEQLKFAQDIQAVSINVRQEELMDRTKELEKNLYNTKQDKKRKTLFLLGFLLLSVLGFLGHKQVMKNYTKNLDMAAYMFPYKNTHHPMLRSQEQVSNMDKAFEAYENNDFVNAILFFDQIEEDSTEAIVFYKSVSELMLTHHKIAENGFLSISKESAYHTPAKYYLALIAIDNEDINAAKKLLQQLEKDKNYKNLSTKASNLLSTIR